MARRAFSIATPWRCIAKRARRDRRRMRFCVREAAEGSGGTAARGTSYICERTALDGSATSMPIVRPLASELDAFSLDDDEAFQSRRTVRSGRQHLVVARGQRSSRCSGAGAARAEAGRTVHRGAVRRRDAVRTARIRSPRREIETLGGVSPRVAPFADVRDLGGLLQRAGFALPVADVERTVVRYRDFMTLVRDLRAMGETNALVERSRKPMSRATLAAAMAHYAQPSRRCGRTPARDVRHRLSDRLGAAREPAAAAQARQRDGAAGRRAEHGRAQRGRTAPKR